MLDELSTSDIKPRSLVSFVDNIPLQIRFGSHSFRLRASAVGDFRNLLHLGHQLSMTFRIRAAVSGQTKHENFVLEKFHLEEIAADYSPDVHPAILRFEHNSPEALKFYGMEKFTGLGMVLGAEVEKWKGRLALFLVCEEGPNLKKVLQEDPYYWMSISLALKFALTQRTYLWETSLTNSPASAGVEQIQLSKDGGKILRLQAATDIDLNRAVFMEGGGDLSIWEKLKGKNTDAAETEKLSAVEKTEAKKPAVDADADSVNPTLTKLSEADVDAVVRQAHHFDPVAAQTAVETLAASNAQLTAKVTEQGATLSAALDEVKALTAEVKNLTTVIKNAMAEETGEKQPDKVHGQSSDLSGSAAKPVYA